jgi:phosphonoacetaldehyde hydrolase
MDFFFKRFYRGNIKAVIFDWAGTTVDFGCFAPAIVFVDVFKNKGIDITFEQARRPMGLNKREHIHEIIKMPDISEKWFRNFGKNWAESDIDELYKNFIPKQIEILADHSGLVPGILEITEQLKNGGIKIGSTTGYNSDMISVVLEETKKYGFIPDSIVCANEVSAGRPAPWMAIQNALNLRTYPLESIMKIGDTVHDIAEGLNAGMWSIGVVTSSNDMGMTLEDIKNSDPVFLEDKKHKIRTRFYEAGAHYVIDSLDEILRVVDEINYKLQTGEKP